MLLKNKSKTFAIRANHSFIKVNEYGFLFKFLPCLSIWYFDKNICIESGWLIINIELWIGNVKELKDY